MPKKEKETSNGISYNKKINSNKSQVPLGVALVILIIVLGLFFGRVSSILGVYWFTGIGFGFILQKSRFCFTAAIRDPFLIGITPITKAVLIAIGLTTIAFTIIKYAAFTQGNVIPGADFIRPVALSTVIGGLIFGIGMVISSGCASGTLMRIGEGFQIQIITLIFFIIGSLWGAHDLNWWSKHFVIRQEGIFLPDKLGWLGAFLLQIFVIIILYYIVDLWEKRKSDED